MQKVKWGPPIYHFLFTILVSSYVAKQGEKRKHNKTHAHQKNIEKYQSNFYWTHWKKHVHLKPLKIYRSPGQIILVNRGPKPTDMGTIYEVP